MFKFSWPQLSLNEEDVSKKASGLLLATIANVAALGAVILVDTLFVEHSKGEEEASESTEDSE